MDKFTCGQYPVTGKKNLAKDIYDLEIYCPEIAKEAKCGQFLNIKVDGFMLRRPISLCGTDKEKGTVRIVFQVRGEGTAKLSELRKGDLADIVAPLGGHGFDLIDKNKRAVIVGGGIGTPPLLPIAEHFGGNCTVINGFRSASAVILEDDFRKTGAEVIICTDDGTYGRKGFVTDALNDVIAADTPDIIYSCGPTVMLKRIADTAAAKNIRCQVSLEERMGCGVGACLVCVCRTKRNGTEHFDHVCSDGPVFESTEVIFE